MDQPENDGAVGSTEPTQVSDEPVVRNAEVQTSQTKTIMLSSGALKKRVDEAKERGRRQAQTELQAQAKTLGFDSVDEMIKEFTEMKSRPKRESRETQPVEKTEPRQQQQRTEGSGSRRELERLQRENIRLAKERDEAARRERHSEKQRRELRRQVEVKEAERELAILAAKHGIRDPKNIDYAIHMLRQETRGKDDTFLEKFDEDQFFKGLGDSYPHLRGEVIKPVTTGHGLDAQPTPPKAPSGEIAQNGQLDVRKLSKEAFDTLLQEKRLNNVSM